MDFEIIETPRLRLRKLTPAHFNYVFENFPEEEIRVFFGITTEEQFQKEKSRYEQGYTGYNRSLVFFQLMDKASDAVIGGCSLHNWYLDHRRAELGYHMTREDQKGKGLMSEAVGTVVDYGFNKMDLHRIEALIGTNNIPSQKIVQKYNFRQEGLLREHYFTNDKFEDSVLFALLRSEYEMLHGL